MLDDHLVLATKVMCAGILAIFFALVVRGLINRRINTRGLLTAEDGTRSPARVLSLAATVLVAVVYLTSVAEAPNPTSLPPIDEAYLFLLVGTNGLYLSSKSLILGLLDQFLGRRRTPM